MAAESIGSRLVYRERIQNLRDTLQTFRDRSVSEAASGLIAGFGHNNRKLIGVAEARVGGKFAPEGTF